MAGGRLFRTGQSVSVRNGSGVNPPPTGSLPAVSNLCGNFPSFTCGGPEVRALPGQTLGPLAPGSYGRVQIFWTAPSSSSLPAPISSVT